MKRFLAFRGDRHYPGGGWLDFKGSFASLADAVKACGPTSDDTWWHVVDTQSMKIVAGD